MQIDRSEVLKRIKPQWKVLDIGSWEDVLPRADVVIDLNPYETRKNNYPKEKERFNKESWIQGDACRANTWDRFADKEFDFVICSHVLEDIRDPLFVSSQLNRVAKAGYIECPSRFRECAKSNQSDLHTGYDHHRWILDVVQGELVFTPKLGWAHILDYLGNNRRNYLKRYEFHFTGIFWEGSYNYYERFPKGEFWETINLLYFYDHYDYNNAKFIHEIKNGLKNQTTPVGSCLYVDRYKLPIEIAGDKQINKYRNIFMDFKQRWKHFNNNGCFFNKFKSFWIFRRLG